MREIPYPLTKKQLRRAASWPLWALIKYPSPTGFEACVAGECRGQLWAAGLWAEALSEDGSLTACRGEPPYVLLNAHIDTIQTKAEVTEVALRGRVAWTAGSDIIGKVPDLHIGADDKAGVAAVGLIARCYAGSLKVLLTTGEERGGTGAQAVPWGFFEDVSLSVSLDRRGVGDLVTYTVGDVGPSAPPEVIAEVEQITEEAGYPLRQTRGTWGDAAILGKYVPAVNVSIGYYGQHAPGDWVDLRDMEYGMLAVLALLEAHEKGELRSCTLA